MTDSSTLLERLAGLHPRLIDLSLDRMWRILAALGNPQDRLPPVIHVAGTNGKGSVIAYLRAFHEAAGRSVHVYTSPHLAHFHERIRLGRPGGGVLIGEEELAAALAECERINAGQPITVFEIITAAALLVFSRHPADVLLLEVGMGGRLDSTNVVASPLASVITPISLDHTDFLGTDIAAIAGEKAGIIKRGRPVISAPQHPEAATVIASAAARARAPLFIGGEDWQVYEEHGRMVFQDDAGLLDLERPRLPGRHQLENAGIAIAVLRAIEPDFPVSAIEAGLQNADWPARLQNLTGTALSAHAPEGAEIWLDGGHNPAAGRVIAEAMAEMEERDPRPLYLICGMLRTKDALGFLAAFKDIARRVIAVPVPDSDAGIAPAQLADIASSAGLAVARARDVREALHIMPRMETPRILICGSLYLAGAVLRDLETAETA
ncbi:MAG: folylpolyglutamate synthase/dihydrofolate synthase family protein [Flavobacteriaceae bacterium]